jgi:Fe2+ or Zn2+ uptake regulation protein
MTFKRHTILSNTVVELLKTSEHAVSMAQIMDRLNARGLTPNKTTVYRILDKLVVNKTATAIAIKNGTSYYELLTPGHHHHHHFFCYDCETLYCLNACHIEKMAINLTPLLPNPKFKITSHDFNLYGRCQQCPG